MRFDARRHAPLLIAAWWAALTLAVIAWRPLTPVDETRYAAVAWDMWLSGDWLQLRLNGALYGHKPPLLFWLINLGWSIFGVNDWWPRVLTALFSAGALALTWRLARSLGARDDVSAITVLVTASALYWALFTGVLMFDAMLAFFALLGAGCIVRAAAGGGWRAWFCVGVALGGGILSKGPVALLHLLPLALLAPWWTAAAAPESARSWGRWYAGVGLAFAVGAAIALAWAVPAALAGGAAFGREIFWDQTIDRIASTTHHERPVWFYLAAAPLLVFPWLLLPSIWTGFAQLARAPRTLVTRFALAWLLPVVVGFSLFKGKQVQYLLPEVAAFGLLAAAALGARDNGAARRIDNIVVAAVFAAIAIALAVLMKQARFETWFDEAGRTAVLATSTAIGVIALGLALVRARDRLATAAIVGSATVLLVVVGYAGAGRALIANYDLRPTAQHLASVQSAGRPVAHFSKYHGQFQFIGRLSRPLEVSAWRDDLLAWAGRNPDGAVILFSHRPLVHPTAQPEFQQKFRGDRVYVWRAADLPGVSDGWFAGPQDDDPA